MHLFGFLALAGAQLLYTLGDLWKKSLFNVHGLWPALTKPLFLLTLVVTLAGFGLQMYALSKVDLSRMAVIIGMMAVVFSSLAGVFILKESFNGWNWLGLGVAVLAIVLVHIR